MRTRQTLIVLLVLGTLVAACQTTRAPADEDVIPILSGTAFYDDLPGEEQAWWGSVSRDAYTGAAYSLGVDEAPPNLPFEVGNLDLHGGNQEARL
jgi:predicted small secreted protein